VDAFTVEYDLHGSYVGGVVKWNVADCRVESAGGLLGAFVTRPDRRKRCDGTDEVNGAGSKTAVVGEQ
jgi:hypothetical protein